MKWLVSYLVTRNGETSHAWGTVSGSNIRQALEQANLQIRYPLRQDPEVSGVTLIGLWAIRKHE